MKHITCGLIVVAMASAVSFFPVANAVDQHFVTTVYAHGGHCGGGGGHHGYGNSGYGNPGNCSMGQSDTCYYYCDGYDAHLHTNGVCPYVQSASAQSSSVQQEESGSIIMKIQDRLNELGYSCGEIDGIMGPKTESAVKSFKIDNDLKANSTINKTVLKALGL